MKIFFQLFFLIPLIAFGQSNGQTNQDIGEILSGKVFKCKSSIFGGYFYLCDIDLENNKIYWFYTDESLERINVCSRFEKFEFMSDNGIKTHSITIYCNKKRL